MMVESAQNTVECFNRYTTVHRNYPAPLKNIDSQTQAETLASLSHELQRMKHLLSTINLTKDIQQQIWANDNFTDSFTRAALLICQAIQWQVAFARETNL